MILVVKLFDSCHCLMLERCPRAQILQGSSLSVTASRPTTSPTIIMNSDCGAMIAPPMPLTSGDRLEHYEILAPLGAGGMGEVYRATDSKLKREVAIKVLRLTSPQIRAVFCAFIARRNSSLR